MSCKPGMGHPRRDGGRRRARERGRQARVHGGGPRLHHQGRRREAQHGGHGGQVLQAWGGGLQRC